MPSEKAKSWAVLWHATPDTVYVDTPLTCGSQSSATVSQSVLRGCEGTLTDSTLGGKGLSGLQIVLVGFCQLDKTNLSHLERANVSEELPPSDWPMGTSVGHFLD